MQRARKIIGLISAGVLVFTGTFITGRSPAHADCPPMTEGDDVAVNTAPDCNNWYGLGGGDTMTNQNSASIINGNAGNDTIINNGSSGFVSGNSWFGASGQENGNKTLLNNGTVSFDLTGHYGGFGNNDVINNGTAQT